MTFVGGIRLAPSILSADFAALGRDIEAAERGGADQIHVDVMDGHFVPNITIGPPVVRAITQGDHAAARRAPDDQDPDRYLDAFVEAGADDDLGARRSAAASASHHRARSRSCGAKAGVVLNPSTPVVAIEQVAGDVDFVLVMSVNPGFGGQIVHPAAALDEDSRRARRCSIAPATRRRRSKSTAASTSRPWPPWSRPAPSCWSPAMRSSAAATTRRSGGPRAQGRRHRARRRARRRMSGTATGRDHHVDGARALRRNRQDGRRLLRAIISCGSRSAAPTGCGKPAGRIARWKTTAWRCRSSKRTASTARARGTTTRSRSARGRRRCRPCGIAFDYEVVRRADGVVIATGHTVHATIDRHGRPVRLPGSREGPARMKALVTGGAGFIGSHLSERLLDQGAERRRPRLLHGLLSAPAQGAQPRRPARPARTTALSKATSATSISRRCSTA